MNYRARTLCLLLTMCTLTAASEKQIPVSLSKLAALADLVAVVQVRDTDYVYTRAFPGEGSAFLKVLISYKPAKDARDIIEVYEKGLHPNECYFENPTVFEEGRRFLVFLRRNPDDPEGFRGLNQGCALEILVTSDNRYALKYPVDGIALSDDFGPVAARLEFRDDNALISEDVISPVVRDELLARGLIIPYRQGFKYTHGVDLTAARNLIGSGALKPKL